MRTLFDKMRSILDAPSAPEGRRSLSFRAVHNELLDAGSVRLRAGFLDVPSWHLVLTAEP